MRTLREVGEFGLIKRISEKVRMGKCVVRGIGDDAAVISYTKGKYQLFTTDMLVEGVHFKCSEAGFFQIGRKALAVNISDIAAMGGVPLCAQVAVGFPGSLSVRAADEIFRGINTLAGEFGVSVVGGDTVASKNIVLCVSLMGEVKKKDLVLRSGARVGDGVFVTGYLGCSRKSKQFNFIPRVQEAREIVKRFSPSSMMDISDGLASDLQRITEQSGVGAVIFEEQIPFSKGAVLRNALYDGEDFELLFTAALSSVRGVLRGGVFVSCIGRVVEKKNGLILIDSKAVSHSLEQKGFRHF